MVNKNNDIKRQKNLSAKLVLSLILFTYFAGLCCGCSYALKYRQNLDFVTKVTFCENLIKGEKTAVLDHCIRFLIRDITGIISMLVLKYSGVLKGMCRCIPFMISLQNACIYVVNYCNGTTVFSLIFNYIIRDTAISFLIILYCYVIISDILTDKNNLKKDFQKTSVYIAGIIFMYIIDYALKTLVV